MFANPFVSIKVNERKVLDQKTLKFGQQWKISRAFRKLAVIGRFVATGFHKVSFPGEEWSGHCHLRLSPIRNVYSLRFLLCLLVKQGQVWIV